ncbi:hypothetical protein BN59_00780 [Legionella massiliensis]|uniref:Uncharacterized protein n=1 Tax=Legionella massiliensis TaxID=1034943 RepID=A0A078KQ62_9GAMM|nr:hypothetical protein [Legionella massiliensis]CDZ76510.1 hypothetical protein BN59_00780 [Legionella massiliensis]CEE12248.1 hypothetical protein BN1094_00780 [Legionella massiliensis]
MTNNRKKENLSSATLHNRNCYAYLCVLKDKIPESVLNKLETLSPTLAEKLKEIKQQKGYKSNYRYADVYQLFFDVVEDNIKTIFDDERKALVLKRNTLIGTQEFIRLNDQKNLGYSSLARAAKTFASAEKISELEAELKGLDEFINAIYANDNGILEQTYEVIKSLTQGVLSSADAIEKSITTLLEDKTGDKINKKSQTPSEAGGTWGLITAMASDNFKPQHTVSLATRRNYEYNRGLDLAEYRFGTQGQRHEGEARVSPLFERWLDVQQRLHPRQPGQHPFNHIYINNLGYDREGPLNYEGKKERALTLALHDLENRHDNIAVITLPADTGLMSSSDYKKTKDSHNYQAVYDEFLQIASQDPDLEREVKDFYISDKVRKHLFADEQGRYSIETEKVHLQRLLDNSFRALGIGKGTQLSSAQRQAVWFDFIKFELPNYITETLEPNSINFSCKDAIDRGGVSSAYYNLMKSFTLGCPLTREEFDRALHAAPAMVKARGMNHHLDIIWNAVDAYLANNYDEVNQNEGQRWLIEWRDVNCPHERASDLLALRVAQVEWELNSIYTGDLDEQQKIRLDKWKEFVQLVKEQSDKGVSGKRLLLDALTLTSKLYEDPNNVDLVKAYDKIADELDIKYPGVFNVIVGFMKACAGWLFSKIDDSVMEKGWATLQAGLEIDTRKTLIANMKDRLLTLNNPSVESHNDLLENNGGIDITVN